MATNLDELNRLMLEVWGDVQTWQEHQEEQARMWKRFIEQLSQEPEIPEYLRVSEGL